MSKPYEILGLNEEYIKGLTEQERIDAIIDAYYGILFSTKKTTMEKDKATLAYKALLNKAYSDYYLNDNVVEDSHGIRR